MEKEKPKNIKKEFTACLLIGLICIIAAAVCLFVVYRPFVKWKKLNFENNADGIVKFTPGPNAIYYYTIDDVDYAVTLIGIGGGHYSSNEDKGIYILYVNTDNPNDVKRGNLGRPLLIFTIGCAATGVLMIGFGFHQKKRAR